MKTRHTVRALSNHVGLLTFLFTGMVSGLSAPAATLYVSLVSPGPAWPYSTWATAAHSIQDAVDAAAGGGMGLRRTLCVGVGPAEDGWSAQVIPAARAPPGLDVTARAVVNATGPWVEHFLRACTPVGAAVAEWRGIDRLYPPPALAVWSGPFPPAPDSAAAVLIRAKHP